MTSPIPDPKPMPCPGCGKPTSRALVACGPCWKQVPGTLKGRLSATRPNTFDRMRVVGEMRTWLKLNARDAAP